MNLRRTLNQAYGEALVQAIELVTENAITEEDPQRTMVFDDVLNSLTNAYPSIDAAQLAYVADDAVTAAVEGER